MKYILSVQFLLVATSVLATSNTRNNELSQFEIQQADIPLYEPVNIEQQNVAQKVIRSSKSLYEQAPIKNLLPLAQIVDIEILEKQNNELLDKKKQINLHQEKQSLQSDSSSLSYSAERDSYDSESRNFDSQNSDSSFLSSSSDYSQRHSTRWSDSSQSESTYSSSDRSDRAYSSSDRSDRAYSSSDRYDRTYSSSDRTDRAYLSSDRSDRTYSSSDRSDRASSSSSSNSSDDWNSDYTSQKNNVKHQLRVVKSQWKPYKHVTYLVEDFFESV